jgi:hypothetical protein
MLRTFCTRGVKVRWGKVVMWQWALISVQAPWLYENGRNRPVFYLRINAWPPALQFISRFLTTEPMAPHRGLPNPANRPRMSCHDANSRTDRSTLFNSIPGYGMFCSSIFLFFFQKKILLWLCRKLDFGIQRWVVSPTKWSIASKLLWKAGIKLDIPRKLQIPT